MDNIKIINLEDYTLTGGGRWGESYNHKENPNLMMKLYALEQAQMAIDEYERAKKVFDLGIPTPEALELIQSPDGRLGIVFRRIPDKKSFARAVGENPEEAEKFASRFASMCKNLHATKVPEGLFPSIKEKYLGVVKDFTLMDSEIRDGILRFIDSVPDSDTAVHGDLHFGNVIFSGEEDWFIDLGEFSYGNPMFDFGMSMISMCLMREEPMKEMFHTDKSTALRFWHTFLQGYFGKDCRVEAIENEILPFAAIRAIYIESLEGRIIPPFNSIVLEALEKGHFKA